MYATSLHTGAFQRRCGPRLVGLTFNDSPVMICVQFKAAAAADVDERSIRNIRCIQIGVGDFKRGTIDT